MPIEEYLIKIVSEFDDTGFKKLEKFEQNTDKNAQKLSFSLKKMVKNAFLNNEFLQTAGNTGFIEKFLKFTGGDDIQPDIKAVKKSSASVLSPLANSPAGFSSDVVRKFDSRKILSFVFDKIFSGSDTQISGKSIFNNLAANALSSLKSIFSEKNFYKTAGVSFDSNISVPKLSNHISFSNFKNTGFDENFASKSFYTLKNFLINSASELKNILPEMVFPEISSNISSPDVINNQSYFESAGNTENSTLQEISNSNGISVTVESGAIQINTSSDNPQEIGSEVQSALIAALDDFILKRGFTKAV